MTELKKRITDWVGKNPQKTAYITTGAVLCLAVLVLIVCLSAGGGEDPSSVPSDAERTSDWPKHSLLADIPEPDAGEIVAVHQTARSVAVFFEEFPAEELQAYLTSTGLSFTGSAPYVAEADGRTVAVEYSAKEKRLSITVADS